MTSGRSVTSIPNLLPSGGMVPSWLLVVSLALLVVLALLVRAWHALKRSLWAFTGGDGAAANPFRKVHPPSPVELVVDHRERDKVLKQSFSPEKVPESLDAIVIGERARLTWPLVPLAPYGHTSAEAIKS